MQYCDCPRVKPRNEQSFLILECLECEDQAVPCTSCGKRAWWAGPDRLRALNAAEAHRWQTDHERVVVRNSENIILREVLGGLAAA
jgi:hypothetical protein